MSDQPIHSAVAIQPDALYSPDEAAWILGYRGTSRKANTNRVHEIPYEELARVPVGPRGGKTMFLGRDLLGFIESRRRTRKAG